MSPKMWIPWLIISCCCCSVINGDQGNILEKEKEILDKILNSSSYDSRVRPLEDVNVMSPTRVKVSMFIKMISRIDDVRMQYNAQIVLRQKWLDNRLKYDNLELTGELKTINLFEEVIWTPDLFVANEWGGYVNSILKPNKYIRIYRNGEVLYSVRVSLVLSCPMAFIYFPFDTQECSIEVESYGFSLEDISYEWSDNPIQIPTDLVFAHYTMTAYEAKAYHISLTSGNYSRLMVHIELKRKLLHHVMHLFIPSMLLVVASWIVFWLDHQFVMTRLFVSLTTLLALFYKTSDYNASLFPVSYTRSVDIWTGTCLTFVFSALLEVVMVDHRWRQHQKQRSATGVRETTGDVTGSAADVPRSPTTQNGRLRNLYYRLVHNLTAGPKKLDLISRYLFPLNFVIFNFFYWISNLS